MNLWDWLKGVFGRAVSLAKAAGLSDELIQHALSLVRLYAGQQITNNEKREAVVTLLTKARIPESIARLAVELAYQLYKAEVAKAG